MFLDCPAWLDNDGTVRCGLPAEVKRRYITRSTDGAPRKHHDQLPCRALVQRAHRIPHPESGDKHPQGLAGAVASAMQG